MRFLGEKKDREMWKFKKITNFKRIKIAKKDFRIIRIQYILNYKISCLSFIKIIASLLM